MPEGSRDAEFRDHAANERTMLAWLRTGISLMAFGFAIARFALYLRETAQMQGAFTRHGLGSMWFGAALVVLGLVVNAAATLRYKTNRKAIATRTPFSPDPMLVYIVAVGSIFIAALMAVVLAGSGAND